MAGDGQKINAEAAAVGTETQVAFEKAQETVGEARNFQRKAMYTEWDVVYSKHPEAGELSAKMNGTIATAKEYFDHNLDSRFKCNKFLLSVI